MDVVSSIIAQASGHTEPHLLRDFAIIMAVAGLAMVLCRWVKLPTVLGYLACGALIGPSALGAVENVETIRLLADLGLVLLLFGIGLELGWRRIRDVGGAVIVIASIEMAVMFALGFEIAILMGWSDINAVFLGSAMCISSSAILMTMLRESEQLLETRGRLIVGILVVEDFAAVILLTVLAGIATAEGADVRSIGTLLLKLGAFSVLALVLGAFLAEKLANIFNRFQSEETLLIVGLTLCFGLALTAEQLGLSGAAGAFLIGAVLGDSHHAGEMDRIMRPVRTMFAAIFFVSIGMLINVSLMDDYIFPTLIVTAVFVLGKIIADTMATFLTGQSGRVSLSVGFGMPQMGEFSLAMVKIGADFGALGTFMYPVVTGVTAITALLYPVIFRSSDAFARFTERRSPRLLQRYGRDMGLALATLRSAFQFNSARAKQIQRSSRAILLDLGIIALFLVLGTGSVRFTTELSEVVHLSESILGLIIGGAVLALCIPPGIAMWRSLRTLADGLVEYRLPRYLGIADSWTQGHLRAVFRDTALLPILVIPGVWSIPLVSRLVALGSFSAPLPLLMVTAIVAALAVVAFRIHRVLKELFSQTFLGEDDPSSPDDSARAEGGDGTDRTTD